MKLFIYTNLKDYMDYKDLVEVSGTYHRIFTHVKVNKRPRPSPAHQDQNGVRGTYTGYHGEGPNAIWTDGGWFIPHNPYGPAFTSLDKELFVQAWFLNGKRWSAGPNGAVEITDTRTHKMSITSASDLGADCFTETATLHWEQPDQSIKDVTIEIRSFRLVEHWKDKSTKFQYPFFVGEALSINYRTQKLTRRTVYDYNGNLTQDTKYHSSGLIKTKNHLGLLHSFNGEPSVITSKGVNQWHENGLLIRTE